MPPPRRHHFPHSPRRRQNQRRHLPDDGSHRTRHAAAARPAQGKSRCPRRTIRRHRPRIQKRPGHHLRLRPDDSLRSFRRRSHRLRPKNSRPDPQHHPRHHRISEVRSPAGNFRRTRRSPTSCRSHRLRNFRCHARHSHPLRRRFQSVPGDEGLLRQALLNLARNAAEASVGAANGGRVLLRGEVVRGPETGFQRITIFDNGPGIPNAARGKLFRPFYTTKANGTGLGLAVVQKIVDPARRPGRRPQSSRRRRRVYRYVTRVRGASRSGRIKKGRYLRTRKHSLFGKQDSMRANRG